MVNLLHSEFANLGTQTFRRCDSEMLELLPPVGVELAGLIGFTGVAGVTGVTGFAVLAGVVIVPNLENMIKLT
jgi:hypothetical protein